MNFRKLAEVYEKVIAGGRYVIPVVVQDITTKEVLILAYADEEALLYSLKNRVATFWSTSRNELWVKGATSGNTLELIEVRFDCEDNSLLYMVKPLNGCGACHVINKEGEPFKSCFHAVIKYSPK